MNYEPTTDRTTTSIGGYTPDGNYCTYLAGDQGVLDSGGVSTTYAIKASANADAQKQEGVISVDATNITITWTKTGSIVGTMNIIWEAQ